MKWLKRLLGREKEDSRVKAASFAGGQYGSQISINEQQATDAMIKGMEQFNDMVSRVSNKSIAPLRRGHLFEAIIAAKENANNAAAGNAELVKITHLEGRNTDPADLEIFSNGHLVGQAQAKFSVRAPDKIVNMIVDPKYEGMDRWIPSNKVKDVREELLRQISSTADPGKAAQLKDALKHLKEHDTTTIEVWAADKSPSAYSTSMEMKFVAREASAAGAQAAIGAAVIGGGISIIKNVISVCNGNISGKQAVCNVASDGGKAAVKGGAVGMGGALVRYGAQKAGIQALVKSNAATAVAAGLIEVGGVVLDFAKGRISSEEAVVKIGENGISSVSGFYSGAVAGMAFGPVGAVVGSMVGYMVASNVYQACSSILQQANLAEVESLRIQSLSVAACEAMRQQREEFEALLEERLSVKRHEFQQCFIQIDSGLSTGSCSETVEGFASLTAMFGKKLKLQSFDEFDDFMKKTDLPLRL